MRLLLGSAVALVMTAPRTSDACTIAPLFGDSRPTDGTIDLPLDGTIFIEAQYFAMTPMTAELYDPRAESAVLLEVQAHGRDLIQLHLPQLEEGIPYTVTVFLQGRTEGKSLSFRAADLADRVPPVQGMRLDLGEYSSEPDLCLMPGGWIVTASFDPATDNRGVAAYMLRELKPNEEITHSAALAPADGTTPELKAYVGSELGDHCFFVEAFDVAGNSSGIGSVHCLDVGPGNEPVEPDYYGPPGDNGLALEEGGGCGCSAQHAGSASPSTWLVLAMVLLLGSRRFSTQP